MNKTFVYVICLLVLMSSFATAVSSSGITGGPLSTLTDTAFDNPEGVGDALVFAAWDVSDSKTNFVNIINTDTIKGQIVKLIFQASGASIEQRAEYYIYLAAADTLIFGIVQSSPTNPGLIFSQQALILQGYTPATNKFSLSQLPMNQPFPLQVMNIAPLTPPTQFTALKGSLTVIGIEQAPASGVYSNPSTGFVRTPTDAPNKLKGNIQILNLNQQKAGAYEAEAIANFNTQGSLFEIVKDQQNNDVPCITALYPQNANEDPAQFPPNDYRPIYCKPYLLDNKQIEFVLSKQQVYDTFTENNAQGLQTEFYEFLPKINLQTPFTVPHYFTDSMGTSSLSSTTFTDFVNYKPLGTLAPAEIFINGAQKGLLNFDFTSQIFPTTGIFSFFGDTYTQYIGVPELGLKQETMQMFNGGDLLYTMLPHVYTKNWAESSLYMNKAGTGDALICGYWAASMNANFDQMTQIKISNTDTQKGIIYKLRIRSGINGLPIFEKDLAINPGDNHEINLIRSSPSSIQMMYDTDDAKVVSCTATNCNLQKGASDSINLASTFPEQINNGYIEIIGVETFQAAQPLPLTITRLKQDAPNTLIAEAIILGSEDDMVNIAKSYYRCTALANFNDKGMFECVSGPQTLPLPPAGKQCAVNDNCYMPPYSYDQYYLCQSDNMCGDALTLPECTTDQDCTARFNQYAKCKTYDTDPRTLMPWPDELSHKYCAAVQPYSYKLCGPDLADAKEGLTKVEMALSAESTINHFTAENNVQGTTRILLTFPTKYYNYDFGIQSSLDQTGTLIPSATNPFKTTTSTASQNFPTYIYSNDKMTLPNQQLTSLSFNNAVNLYATSPTTDPAVPPLNQISIQSPQRSGWMKFTFSSDHTATPATPWDYFGTTKVSAYQGLPVVGFVDYKYVMTSPQMILYKTTVPLNKEQKLAKVVYVPTCGDGIIEAPEECEPPSNFGEKTCADYGYTGGTLACGGAGSLNECKVNTSGCSFTNQFCVAPQILYSGKYIGDLGHRLSWTGDWEIGVWSSQGYYPGCTNTYSGTVALGQQVCTNICEVLGQNLKLYIDLKFDDSNYLNEFGPTLFTWGPFNYSR